MNTKFKLKLTVTECFVYNHLVDLICAEHCNKCDVNGEGNCDEDECANGFHYNGTTKMCDVNGEILNTKYMGHVF